MKTAKPVAYAIPVGCVEKVLKKHKCPTQRGIKHRHNRLKNAIKCVTIPL